jgi:hypothetical protein
MRLVLPLALVLVSLSSCGPAQTPYATSVGVLQPGQRMVVRIDRGTVNAYAPAVGQPRDRFTIEAFAQSPGSASIAPSIRPIRGGIEVRAATLQSLLVRVPQGVDVVIVSGGGDVNVTDISGTARATTTAGNITMMLPAYGSASITRRGTIQLIVGAATWPGTISATTPTGDVNLSVNENDRFRANLTTNDGTIFTDFNLRGTSTGKRERIVGLANGGSGSSLVASTGKGAIRLLRLAPQY